MINFKLLVDNRSDGATLSLAGGTTVASTLPLVNLQKYNNSKVTRFTSYAESTINGNFPANQLVNLVAIWRHTLTNSATWIVKLYDAINQGGTLVYDSGEIASVPPKSLDELDWGIDELNAGAVIGVGTKCTALYPDNIICRSFQITIKDPTNADTFFDVARLYMGRALETEINADYGMKNGIVDNSPQTRTVGGGLWTTPVTEFQKVSFTLAQMNEKDRATMWSGYYFARKQLDVFVAMFPEAAGYLEVDYTFAGKFTNSPEFENNFFNNYVAEFEIEEC